MFWLIFTRSREKTKVEILLNNQGYKTLSGMQKGVELSQDILTKSKTNAHINYLQE